MNQRETIEAPFRAQNKLIEAGWQSFSQMTMQGASSEELARGKAIFYAGADTTMQGVAAALQSSDAKPGLLALLDEIKIWHDEIKQRAAAAEAARRR